MNTAGGVNVFDAIGSDRDRAPYGGLWRHTREQRREQPRDRGVTRAGRSRNLRLEAGNEQLAVRPVGRIQERRFANIARRAQVESLIAQLQANDARAPRQQFISQARQQRRSPHPQ